MKKQTYRDSRRWQRNFSIWRLRPPRNSDHSSVILKRKQQSKLQNDLPPLRHFYHIWHWTYLILPSVASIFGHTEAELCASACRGSGVSKAAGELVAISPLPSRMNGRWGREFWEEDQKGKRRRSVIDSWRSNWSISSLYTSFSCSLIGSLTTRTKTTIVRGSQGHSRLAGELRKKR